MFGKAAFQVAGFIPVNDMLFGKFVQHGIYPREHFFGFLFAGGFMQLFHCIPGCPGIISVPQTPGFGLPDPFQC